MKSILFVTDNSPHNIDYLVPLFDLASTKYKVDVKIFGSNEDRVIPVEELNKYLVVITDISYHGTLRDPSYDKLTANILSINHSLLGPVNFNTYQTKCLKKLSEHVRSKVICLYPSYYKKFMDSEIINDPSTEFVEGSHRYLLSKYNAESSIGSFCTYFNHWSAELSTVKSIIDKFSAFNLPLTIRMHPAYNTMDSKDNPLNTMKNVSNTDDHRNLFNLMKIYNNYPHISVLTQIDSSDVLVFDGLSGTLLESIVRKCMTFKSGNKADFYLKKTEGTPVNYSSAHSNEDIKLVESMMMSFGAEVVFDDQWIKLTLNDSNIIEFKSRLGIDQDQVYSFMRILHVMDITDGSYQPKLDNGSSPLSVSNLLRDWS